MAKTMRFAELVKASGRPHVATLWTSPKSDPEFAKAIRDNRVLTVRQETTGSKKDFGTIGFHERKNASYFIFPKPLPSIGETRIIGIKYDLLKAAKPTNALTSKDLKSKPKNAKRETVGREEESKRINSTYTAVLRRTAVWETSITLRAANKAEAEERAREQARKTDLRMEDAIVHDEIRALKEKD